MAWIHVAPIKALHVDDVERVELGRRGIAEDRRFCVVDEEGRMQNAKRIPRLVAVRPRVAGDTLMLRMPDGTVVDGPLVLGAAVPVSLYRRHPAARVVEGPFGEALSTLAGRPLRLIRFDDEGEGVDRGEDAGASLLSVAALDAMAEAAETDGAVDPRRFRMNFGIAGVAAHEEDGWMGRRVRIGGATVIPRGNVGRCAVTTLDPDEGVPTLDTLAALARYRGALRTTEPLAFGVWASVASPGPVAVGDPVVPA